jgi:ubiquinone/menaquinone biosynthesis C-methylase UbiE
VQDAHENDRRYVHGYQPAEQRRLLAQAEFWRASLILDGTTFEPGTRLLDIGCGVGAVLATIGTAFPRVRLAGVDIEQEQIEAGRELLAEQGLRADLQVADARRLPYPDNSVDHVWTMWLLEHLSEQDAVAVLAEARRVLVPGGRITSIEADYGTLKLGPLTPALEAVRFALVEAMRLFGQHDAGTQLWGWLDQAGYRDIEPGERLFSYRGIEVSPAAAYVADAIAATVTDIADIPSVADEATLRQGLRELRDLADNPDAWLRFVIHKAQARA